MDNKYLVMEAEDFRMSHKILWACIDGNEIFLKIFDGPQNLFFITFLFPNFYRLVLEKRKSYENISYSFAKISL